LIFRLVTLVFGVLVFGTFDCPDIPLGFQIEIGVLFVFHFVTGLGF